MTRPFTLEESKILSDYMATLNDRVDRMAQDWHLGALIAKNDVNAVKTVLRQCLWVGFCDGRFEEHNENSD